MAKRPKDKAILHLEASKVAENHGFDPDSPLKRGELLLRRGDDTSLVEPLVEKACAAPGSHRMLEISRTFDVFSRDFGGFRTFSDVFGLK